jgi:phage protein D
MTAPPRLFTADPLVKAPGQLADVWHNQLVRTVVEQSIGRPDLAVLTFRDPTRKLTEATKIRIGTPLTVSAAVPKRRSMVELFSGEVTALELDFDSTGSFSVVHALGREHRLQRGRRVVAFENKTAEVIIREVITGGGLTPGDIDVPTVTYPQLTQAAVSDWEFLQDLAAQLGAVVSVDDRGHVHVAPPNPASAGTTVKLEHGDNLLALRGSLTTADQVGAVQVRGWDVAAKRAVVANVATRPSDSVRPHLAAQPALFGPATALVVDTPYGTTAEATAAADALAGSISAGFAELEAVATGAPELRAGTPITLVAASPDFDGDYTATTVRHTIDADTGYRSTVLVSATADRSLGGLTAGAGPRARAPRFPGVVTAVVAEVDKSAAGLVRLKFPWLDEDYKSGLVRTVQFGGQGGGVICPDVNDEVLVAFEQGCIDRPYVLGGLYNGRNGPSPHTLALTTGAGAVNRRSLVSRKGHRLELIDGIAGPPGVRVASGDGKLEIRLDAARDQLTLTRYGGHEQNQGTGPVSSIRLTADGITIDAGAGALTLTGGSVTVDAGAGALNLTGGSVTVTGRTGVSVDGGPETKLRGGFILLN